MRAARTRLTPSAKATVSSNVSLVSAVVIMFFLASGFGPLYPCPYNGPSRTLFHSPRPLDGAFTKPTCNRELSGLLEDKGVGLVTEFNTGEVDGQGGRLVSYDGREVPFDLAVVVPLHGGQAYVERSPGLGDELGFVPTDQRTLQSKAAPNVFVIGDAADIPASKAGSVAHFEGDILARNITRYLAGEPLDAVFDGHANCFIESGFGQALLIDFNYDTEPVTGRFPGRLGLPLLRQSRLNHLGKLAFGWLYWHVLLPGRDIPAVRSQMPTAGKRPLDGPRPADSPAPPRKARCPACRLS